MGVNAALSCNFGFIFEGAIMSISRCLHLMDPSLVCQDRSALEFDKMWQIRWLLDGMAERCNAQWNVGQFITIDEMMVRYKGSYCPARQYMPKKPQKWGLKV
jgi:hypothetical protein